MNKISVYGSGVEHRKSLVTGGAGFIGSHLVDRLIQRGDEVTVIDNLRTGRKSFINPRANFVNLDIGDSDSLAKYFVGVNDVYHLAANADVRNGWDDPLRDFEENLVKTLNIARLSAESSVENLIFSSTGSIYGDASVFPTPENYSVDHQTSLYGASKYSCESFLGAYAEANKFKVTVLRFVSVLGPRYTHGHVYDFIKQLINDPTKLVVLGDGNQTKSYMHVSDCVDAIATLRGSSDFEVFNVGQKDTLSVHRSIEVITGILNATPELHFASSDRGWIGDSPVILLDTQKANSSGWQPKVVIEDALKDTVNWIIQNQWVYNK